jgi:hypothetical protein
MKAALGLPLLAGNSEAGGLHQLRASNVDPPPLFTGLAGLDYALDGMAAGELLCVAGPPATGKTLLLLDLAARICGRYGKNVVFWSAHQPSVYLVRIMAIKDARVAFAEDTVFVDDWDRGVGDSAGVVLVPSGNPTADRAHRLANLLTADHPGGCVALVMDGWSTTREPRENIEFVDGIAAFTAERWPHAPLSAADIDQAKQFAQVNRVPVVMGVKTASLMDDEAAAESLYVEERLRIAANRWVTLHRPELYVETSQKIAADRNVVCLSGISSRWWDTRNSRLRFDPRRRVFQTV